MCGRNGSLLLTLTSYRVQVAKAADEDGDGVVTEAEMIKKYTVVIYVLMCACVLPEAEMPKVMNK